MKIISKVFFLFIILSISACAITHDTEYYLRNSGDLMIALKTYSRGTHKTISIENKTISHFNHNQKISDNVLSEVEWNQIYQLLKEIKLENLEHLNVPSKKHASDASLAENLSVYIGKEKHQSPTYDANNPPIKIKPLVNYIKSLK